MTDRAVPPRSRLGCACHGWLGTPAWTCPACAIEAALVLLATGRPEMARRMLEPVPGMVGDMVGRAYGVGHDRAVVGRRIAR